MSDSFPFTPKEMMLPQYLHRIAMNCMPLDSGLKEFKRPHFMHLANLSFCIFFFWAPSNTVLELP
jgi:hypothetical protein